MKEVVMSGRNGDKARFDRERKKKNLRKKRTRELKQRLLLNSGGTQTAVPESK